MTLPDSLNNRNLDLSHSFSFIIIIREMLTDVIRVMVNNPFKKSFCGKKNN